MDGGSWADSLQLPLGLEFSPEAILSSGYQPVTELEQQRWVFTTQHSTLLAGSLYSGAPHQPSQDFLRASLQSEASPTQTSFLPSPLSDQHYGLKPSSHMPPTSPLLPITPVSSKAFGKVGNGVSIIWTLW